MEKHTFTRVNLSNVRVIVSIMRVPMVELLCQELMGYISVLKYLLSGVCGCLWPCPIVPSINCRYFLRS
jgi:hypothetical protein